MTACEALPIAASVLRRPRARKSPQAPDLAAQLAALHPFARDDIAHELRYRFGEFLAAPRRLKSLLQRHFVERLAASSSTWSRSSVLAYVEGKRAAVDATAQLVARFERAAALVPLDARERDIRDLARNRAELMRSCSVLPGYTRRLVREHLSARCRELGIAPPRDDPRRGGYVATEPAIARMICPLWWRRRLRVAHVAAVGAAYRELGRVSAGRELFASDFTVQRRAEQLAENARAAAATWLQNAAGRRISRAQAIASSVSNPDVRAAELMTRIAGVESWASENGYTSLFVTITAPSRMHRRTQSADGRAVFDNPAFDPAWASPRRVHREYLAPLWSRCRAALHRSGLAFFGTRSVEPHHDGTPHWHLMLFCRPAERDAVIDVLRDFAMRDSPDERGAARHRFTVKEVPAGFVAHYLAKYVLALARADDLAADLAGSASARSSGAPIGSAIAMAESYRPSSSGASAARPVDQAEPRRASAWAWENGIRQFQFFGVPEVGVWRELRRLRLVDERGRPNPQLARAPLALQEAALAVNRVREVDRTTGEVTTLKPADFGDYIRAQGGCGGPRSARPLRVARELAEQLSRYGEPITEPIGVSCYSSRVSIDQAGELRAEPPELELYPIDRDRWLVVGFAPPPRTVIATGPRSRAAGALLPTGPPDWAPYATSTAPPAGPIDRLDRELHREIEQAGDALGRVWYWPRSGVPSTRPAAPPSADEAALALDLARDLARLGPMP